MNTAIPPQISHQNNQLSQEANLDLAQQQAISVVESLRAGIPTRLSTRQLPDLRPELTRLIEQDLAQLEAGHHPRGRLIWGSYGQGKTHALTALEHLALDRGFAVSRVALSREVSCHQLFNFYGRVAPLIRLPDSASGLAALLSRKSPQGIQSSIMDRLDRYQHPLPAFVLENLLYASGEDQDLLYGDLVGSRLTLTDLRRIHRANRDGVMPRFERTFKVSEDGAAYFGVMADALKTFGYKGWVLLIDEVELIGRLGKVSRLKAYRNLQWLLNWSALQPNSFPLYTIGVVASGLRTDLWYRGTTNTRTLSDSVAIPDLALEKLGSQEIAQEMKTFFTQAIDPHCPVLKPLLPQAQKTLLTEIITLHGIAFGWDPSLDLDLLAQQLGDKPVRTYIRATLESLDMAYLYQESWQVATTELQEASLVEDEAYFRLEDPDGFS